MQRPNPVSALSTVSGRKQADSSTVSGGVAEVVTSVKKCVSLQPSVSGGLLERKMHDLRGPRRD